RRARPRSGARGAQNADSPAFAQVHRAARCSGVITPGELGEMPMRMRVKALRRAAVLPPPESGSADPVLSDAVAQCVAGDAEELGGAGHISLGVGQRAADQGALRVPQDGPWLHGGVPAGRQVGPITRKQRQYRRSFKQFRWRDAEMRFVDDITAGTEQRLLDDITQLADVARPEVV